MGISLHRVIAEIKSLEEKLNLSVPVVAACSSKDQMVGNLTKEKFEAQSQGAIDEFTANLSRLRKLKAARNLANSTTVVKIAGSEMTIDEAIIYKVTSEKLRTFVQFVKSQMVAAANQVAIASAEVEKKIEAQAIAIGGSTKKIDQNELDTIRRMFQKSTGKEIAIGSNVEDFIAKATKSLDEFAVEVDYVLSEANAKTLVEV